MGSGDCLTAWPSVIFCVSRNRVLLRRVWGTSLQLSLYVRVIQRHLSSAPPSPTCPSTWALLPQCSQRNQQEGKQRNYEGSAAQITVPTLSHSLYDLEQVTHHPLALASSSVKWEFYTPRITQPGRSCPIFPAGATSTYHGLKVRTWESTFSV